MASKTIGLCFLTSILAICSAQDPLSLKDSSQPSCEDVCENTYPLHTYEKASHLGCCKRGCRLFTIIDFTEEFQSVNATRKSCEVSCKDAYSGEEESDACIIGCRAQTPCFSNHFSELDGFLSPSGGSQFDVFTPLLYVHDMYSNMFSKLHESMTVSWTFYVQGDNGQLVVIQSASPRVLQMPMEDGEEQKTSNYLESNLMAVDNSATPNLKNSQMQRLSERDLGINDEIIVEPEEQSSDFLGCIARKTGLPKLLLSVTIFLSALVMIWLCISSAVTAPDQHVKGNQPPPPPPKKLSIYGDLEYLLETSDEDKAWLLAAVHQPTHKPASTSTQQAPPLPLKIKVETV